MKVGLLTIDEKNSLVGQLVKPNWFFNPVQDCKGNWIISLEEMEGSTNPSLNWVKSLSTIEWCGPFVPPSPSGSTENYVGS